MKYFLFFKFRVNLFAHSQWSQIVSNSESVRGSRSSIFVSEAVREVSSAKTLIEKKLEA